MPLPPSGGFRRYCGLLETSQLNQRRIFLTVRFLVNRLTDIFQGKQLQMDLQALARGGYFFVQLAKELDIAEPSLRGVTAMALSATLSRASMNVHNYHQFIANATGDLPINTHLLSLCEDLHALEIAILEFKQKRSGLTDKEKQRLLHDSESRRFRLELIVKRRRVHPQKRIRTREIGLSEITHDGNPDGSWTPNIVQAQSVDDILNETEATIQSNNMEQDKQPAFPSADSMTYLEQTRLIVKVISSFHTQQQKWLDREFTKVKSCISGMESCLLGMDSRLDGMESRLDGMEVRLSGIEYRFNGSDMLIRDIPRQLNSLVQRSQVEQQTHLQTM